MNFKSASLYTTNKTNKCNISFILYSIDAVSIGSAYFGLGSGPINMDNVLCTGDENILTNCTFSSEHNCGHSEDASVICIDTECK